MIQEALRKVITGENLLEPEMIGVMQEIMSGEATPAQIGAFLAALRIKGETVAEITGAARVMRDHALKIKTAGAMRVVDTCGTGGDGSNTFNISTAAAFVAAGAGLTVAKHGNRSVSSRCGSADVLAALGVNIRIESELVERCLEAIGIGFLFAPSFHKAMKHVAGPRREMGVRTIFNILGPLTNPAGAQCQVLGVYDAALTELMAEVLLNLGSTHVFVVHGEDGLDEFTLTAPTRVSEMRNGTVNTYLVHPEELGLASCSHEALVGGDAETNAAIIRDIFDGGRGPRRDIVLLNAAATLVAGGKAGDMPGGLRLAAEVIDAGHARAKLDALVDITN